MQGHHNNCPAAANHGLSHYPTPNLAITSTEQVNLIYGRNSAGRLLPFRATCHSTAAWDPRSLEARTLLALLCSSEHGSWMSSIKEDKNNNQQGYCLFWLGWDGIGWDNLILNQHQHHHRIPRAYRGRKLGFLGMARGGACFLGVNFLDGKSKGKKRKRNDHWN